VSTNPLEYYVNFNKSTSPTGERSGRDQVISVLHCMAKDVFYMKKLYLTGYRKASPFLAGVFDTGNKHTIFGEFLN
jgi:hypothetical protein